MFQQYNSMGVKLSQSFPPTVIRLSSLDKIDLFDLSAFPFASG